MGTLEVQGALGEVSEGRLLLFSCISRGALLSAQLLLGLLGAFSTVLVTNRAGSSPGAGEGQEGDPTCVPVSCHALPCQVGLPSFASLC